MREVCAPIGKEDLELRPGGSLLPGKSCDVRGKIFRLCGFDSDKTPLNLN